VTDVIFGSANGKPASTANAKAAHETGHPAGQRGPKQADYDRCVASGLRTPLMSRITNSPKLVTGVGVNDDLAEIGQGLDCQDIGADAPQPASDRAG